MRNTTRRRCGKESATGWRNSASVRPTIFDLGNEPHGDDARVQEGIKACTASSTTK